MEEIRITDMAKIILLSMSTFPRMPKQNDFILQDRNWTDAKGRNMGNKTIKNCISQLEPPVRVFMNQWKEEDRGKTDDNTYVIILCSEAARHDKASNAFKNLDPENDENPKYDTELVRILKSTDITPAEFLIDRLTGEDISRPVPFQRMDYGKEIAEPSADYKADDAASVRYWLYQKRDPAGRIMEFQVIPFEARNPMPAIKEAVINIRSLNNHFRFVKRIRPKFYIAANGGLRDDYVSLITIIKLLKTDEISPDKIYSTEMKAPAYVYPAEEGYHLLDFAIGLNEFFHNGDSSNLTQYFITSKAAEKNHPLLKSMNDFSEGTRNCDVNKISAGIKGIRKSMASEKEGDAVYESPEYQIFKQSIRNDYGEKMLADDKDAVETIRWCIRKNLIQQALTLIEAKTGDDLYAHGILAFEPDDPLSEYGDINDSAMDDLEENATVHDYLKACLNSNEKYKADAPHHMIFDKYSYRLRYPIYVKNKNKLVNNEEYLNDHSSQINEILNSAVKGNSWNEFAAVVRKEGMGKWIDKYEIRDNTYSDKRIDGEKRICTVFKLNIFPPTEDTDLQKKRLFLLRILAFIHILLKMERNNMNHAGENWPDINRLKKIMNLHCDVAEAVYQLAER